MIHITWWKIDGTDQVSWEAVFEPTQNLSRVQSFDFNGDFVLLRNRKNCELWLIRDTELMHIPFPICYSYLTVEEFRLNAKRSCVWTISTGGNSQYLVAQFGCALVLVFKDFTSPNYLHRITLPNKVRKVKLSELNGGDGDLKTILIVFTPDTDNIAWCAHVFDITTAKLVGKFVTCENAKVQGAYVFSKDPADKIYRAKNKGIKVTRINWNGNVWSTSTHVVQFPESERNLLSLCKVTDTLVTWNTFDHSSEIPDNEYTRVESELVVSNYSRCEPST